jgi:hypothetical protein
VKAAAEASDLKLTSIVLCSDVDDTLPKTADIEDLFATEDYLRLYNWAFGGAVTADDLPDTAEPLLKRIEDRYGEYDHALPAHALTEHRNEFFSSVAPLTLERFTKLFSLLNSTLEEGHAATAA